MRQRDAMQQFLRLLQYLRPYSLQFVASVLLMALVGLLDAFRLLLIGPIFDRVLNPASQSRLISVPIPGMKNPVMLQDFVLPNMQNPWTVVAFALVTATVLKGICDFAGTYLVNYAGLGLLTDLRSDLYNSLLRRSVGFFQKYSTGTLLSAIVNDMEKVQFAVTAVLAELLQQIFILIFTALVVEKLGGSFAWVLVVFVPFVVFSAIM